MQEVYIRHASPIQPTKTVADKMALLIEQLILVSLGSFPCLKQRKAGLGTEKHLKLTTKWLPILVHVCTYTVRVVARYSQWFAVPEYSQKNWQSLNLALWPQTDLIKLSA